MSLRNELSQTGSLFSAVEAVRNVRAGLLLVLTYVVAALLFGLGAMMAVKVNWAFGALFSLVAAIALFYGANAVGIMVMDEARGGRPRGMVAAVLSSLAVGHRLILVMLAMLAAWLVWLLVMAILLLVCKLPGLGPFLFTFVFPVCVVVSGLAIFGTYAVVVPLAAPAVWSGATTMQCLSRLAAIVRQRIVGVVLSMIVVFLLAAVVFGIVGGIMGAGTFLASSMSAAMLGAGGASLGDIVGIFTRGSSGGSGYLLAGALGGGLVWAIALTLPLLVYLRGASQVYLASVETVDAERVEQQLRASLDNARRKAEEIRARGEALAAAPVAAPIHATPAVERMAPAAAAAFACPACGEMCASGDVFCGSCGHKLA